jgi:hypothetical protein
MDDAVAASTVESVFDRAALDAGTLLQEWDAVQEGTSREFREDATQLEHGVSELNTLVSEDAVVAGVESARLNIDDDLPINSVNYAFPAITLHAISERGHSSQIDRLKALSGLFLNPRNTAAILEAINTGDLQQYYFEVLYRPHNKINYWRLTFPLQYILTHSDPGDGATTPELKEEMQERHPAIFTSDSQVGGAVKELREIPLVKQGRQGRAYAYWPLDQLSQSEAREVFEDRFDDVQETVHDHVNRYYEPPRDDSDDDDEDTISDRDGGDSSDSPQMTTLCDFN